MVLLVQDVQAVTFLLKIRRRGCTLAFLKCDELASLALDSQASYSQEAFGHTDLKGNRGIS